jgi:hypothetical protein
LDFRDLVSALAWKQWRRRNVLWSRNMDSHLTTMTVEVPSISGNVRPQILLR